MTFSMFNRYGYCPREPLLHVSNLLSCRCGIIRWVRRCSVPPSNHAHCSLQGLSFGVADGVGGWSDLGVNPGLFSQALMYHAHRYAKEGWAGEPELDPTQGYEEREQVEGWELTPEACLKAAHDAVLRERGVIAG
jgi:hypothetical protein